MKLMAHVCRKHLVQRPEVVALQNNQEHVHVVMSTHPRKVSCAPLNYLQEQIATVATQDNNTGEVFHSHAVDPLA